MGFSRVLPVRCGRRHLLGKGRLFARSDEYGGAWFFHMYELLRLTFETDPVV